MKKLSLMIVSTLIVWACNNEYFSQESLAGDSWPQVQQQGQGALYALYVPAEDFAYFNDDGKLTGVTVDLLNGFAEFLSERYDFDLDIRYVGEENWSRFYRRVAEGGDGLIGMGNVTITEERREELTFSPPYMTNIASLITHQDAPALSSLDQIGSEFQGRDALAFEGTLHEERLRSIKEDYFPDADIVFASSNDEILERVAADDTYFAYIDIYNYWRAAERGKPIRRHEAGDEAAEQFGYIMPLETSWQPVLSEYFEHNGGLLQSGTYKKIMQTHLGPELAELLLDVENVYCNMEL